MLSALLGKSEVRIQSTPLGVWPGESIAPPGQIDVNQSSAMQLLAVAGCVRYITDTISTLPVDVFTSSKGARREVPTPQWLREPTMDMDFTEWCSQVLTSLLLHGNAYVVVHRSSKSTEIVELEPVAPQLISVRREGGRKRYYVAGMPFTAELLHIKGMMLPGTDVGLSPLEYARLSISLGLEAVTYGADNFQQQLNMPGVIEFPGTVNGEVMKETAQAWRRARSGRKNRGLPGIIQQDGKWKPTGVTNEQAQFLQTRQWTAAEIAGQVFLVDPVELGIPVTGTSIEYGNMEQRAQATVRRSFMPWMVRIEQAINSLLPGPTFMKFNIDGLLRADSAARWDNYGKAMAINSIAATLGMPPVQTTVEMRDFEDYGPVEEHVANAARTEAELLAVANAVQKVYLGVGVLITPDEARAIVNAAGGSLPIPAPQALTGAA